MELDTDAISYCWEEGKPIDRMKAESIQCMSMVNAANETIEPEGRADKSDTDMTVESASIWNIVLAHRYDFQEELSTCFLLATTSNESTTREYLLRTPSPSQTLEWVREINSIVDNARPPPETAINRLRRAIYHLYHSPPFRVLVMLLISLNFMAFIYETQAGSHHPSTFHCSGRASQHGDSDIL